MTRDAAATRHPSFIERFLKALLVGTLAMLALYLKVLGAILKFGIQLIQKAPPGK